MSGDSIPDAKLMELTIEMLKGNSNDIFYLSNAYQSRGLDLLSYEDPLSHAFSLNFCSKHINSAAMNVLRDFAQLGSALFLCRLYGSSQPTLQDFSYKEFDEINCGLRSCIVELMASLDEELCSINAKQSSSGKRLQSNTILPINSLLELHLHCRHWWHLFESVVGIIHATFVQLRNGVSSLSATCSLLQLMYEHLNKSTLLEMPFTQLHSSSVSQWGPTKNSRKGRWNPHTNRWFDLFVCRAFESMLFKLLRTYVLTPPEDIAELVYPPFLEQVSGAVLSTVTDLQAMHMNSNGVHTPRDMLTKRDSIIKALNEARDALHASLLQTSYPSALLNTSPLFQYLTSGSAVKKVGLNPPPPNALTTQSKSLAAVSLRNTITAPSVVPCVSTTSFTSRRWFSASSSRVKSSEGSASAGNALAPPKAVPAVSDEHSYPSSDPPVSHLTARPPLYTLGSFPIKFHVAYSTALVEKLQSMDQTVAALVNAEHCVLHQLRYLRDVFLLGRGSEFFSDVRSLCDTLVFTVSSSDDVSPSAGSKVAMLQLHNTVNGLIVEAKPKQEGIESVALICTDPLLTDSQAVLESSRHSSELDALTEHVLLKAVTHWQVDLQLKYPMREILPLSTVPRLNKVLQSLLQLQLVKWIYEFWWKAGVSSGLLSIIREPLNAATEGGSGQPMLSTVEDVDQTVNRLKTNCTVGLNLVLRTVSTLLGHYISSFHFSFAEVFESSLDHQHCLVREYATLLEGLVSTVEGLLSVTSRHITELVTYALTASLHLRSALQLEQQHSGMAHNEPSYFSVVLCFRRAEESFSRCRAVVTQLKKRAEESEQKDLLFKL